MKKIILAVIMCTTIIAFQHTSIAQEVWLGEVIFDDITTENIQQNFLMNELSYTIITMHFRIAKKDIEINDYQWETLATIKKLEELTQTNIIEILDISPNKEEALNKYLNECTQNLQKWDTIAVYMRQEMALLKLDMESCLIDKNISDQAYFDAIERYDQDIMETSLIDSIEYETCATENRIQYNAKTGIARKLVFYLGLLQKKYDLLFAKQEILAKNFEIFRDNILPDLNELDQLLQQYTF